MIVKKFGVDFNSSGGALTLKPDCVTDDDKETSGTHTRTHDSGWTITGEIHEDWHIWVNEFTATHPDLGTVYGDFENEVYATSEAAFAHFWHYHEPEAWTYWDI